MRILINLLDAFKAAYITTLFVALFCYIFFLPFLLIHFGLPDMDYYDAAFLYLFSFIITIGSSSLFFRLSYRMKYGIWA